jgi:hypothetical protein
MKRREWVEKRRAWIYATDKQRLYLKVLANEAFSRGWSIGFDMTDLQLNRCERLLKSEASKYIEQFLTAKRNGWK